MKRIGLHSLRRSRAGSAANPAAGRCGDMPALVRVGLTMGRSAVEALSRSFRLRPGMDVRVSPRFGRYTIDIPPNQDYQASLHDAGRCLAAQPAYCPNNVTALHCLLGNPMSWVGFELCLLQHRLMARTARPSMSGKRGPTRLTKCNRFVESCWCPKATRTYHMRREFQKLRSIAE